MFFSQGIFEVDKLMTTNKRLHHSTQVQWEWQDDKNTWRPYGQVESRIIEHARMAGEEDAAVDIGGRNYIIEFAIMQQINEETGNSRPVRRTHVNTTPPELSDTNNKKQIDDDPRTLALCAEPNLCYSIFHSLFGVLYEVFTNMTAPSIKYKCLKALLRMINCATSELLTEVLSNISVSSYIATMLKSQDYKVVVGAFQMAVLLMDKLPDIFAVYFHREGVMHAMENLKSLQLKSMITPKKPDQPTQPDPPPDPPLPLLSISMPRPSLSTPEASGLSDSPSTARRCVLIHQSCFH
jgi:E3 ubiquitin-protein ligase TRIP12